MADPSEVKDPDGISAEELQERADIKREELAETPPPSVDPNAFDVIGGTESPDKDIESLSVNEKYALVLHQAKQLGPLFFVQVSPDTFKLPERDPLNLIWINILTGWQLASDILSQFELAMIEAESLAKAAEESTDAGTVEINPEGPTETD